MKSSLVRAPFVLGSVIAAALVLLSLFALVTSNPRWDDHLINAAGVFTAGLLISFTLRFATNAFRPQPGTSRALNIVGLLALALVVFIGIAVAVFIDSMSFL